MHHKLVCFFLCLEIHRNISSGRPGHYRTGHQLKWRSVFDRKPHLQLTVFSRELLVLQALKDLKELIALLQLCLQESHLFADGSSWTGGGGGWLKKLHGCCLGGFMLSSTWPKGGPLRDELQRAIKTQLPLTFLRLASISISPPPNLALPFLSVLSLCVVFWPTLTENQRQTLLCQHHRQREKHC